MSDRERLALAFDELKSKGYAAPINYAWDVCCLSCGMRSLEEEGLSTENYVFWHAQKDESCFIGDDMVWPDDWDYPDPDDYNTEEALDQAYEVMLGDPAFQAACQERRVYEFCTIISPLNLHWGNVDDDPTEIIKALENQGFSVLRPENPGKCIEVQLS